MKFLSSLLLFLNFLTCSFGQDYISIIEQNKHFFATSNVSQGWYNGYVGYVMRGDTIVENETYTKIYRQVFEGPTDQLMNYEPPYELRYELLFGLMREDIEERKVYARVYDEEYPLIHWECDDDYEYGDEILLYNFNQSVGDTIDFCPYISEYNIDNEVILDSIYLEEIWGESRRVFLYETVNFTERYYLFEGLGGWEGIFSQLSWISVDEGWYTLLNICTGTNEECGIVDLVATKDIFPLSNEIKLSPNPSAGQFNLNLSEIIIETGAFQITDLTGKIVYSEQFKSGNYTRNLDLPKGFYSASFQQNGQILWQKKLIILKQ